MTTACWPLRPLHLPHNWSNETVDLTSLFSEIGVSLFEYLCFWRIWQASILLCICVSLPPFLLFSQRSSAVEQRQGGRAFPLTESQMCLFPGEASWKLWKCLARMDREGFKEMVFRLFLCFPGLQPLSCTLLFFSFISTFLPVVIGSEATFTSTQTHFPSFSVPAKWGPCTLPPVHPLLSGPSRLLLKVLSFNHFFKKVFFQGSTRSQITSVLLSDSVTI